MNAVETLAESPHFAPEPEASGLIDPQFRLLANSAPVYLWLSDASSRCVFFNDQWLEFTGRSMEQELGYGWVEGVHHEDLQRCLDVYMERFSAREAFEMIYRLRRADGQYRWILDKGKPFYRAPRAFGGFIGSCVDITEQIESEERQKRQTAELERLNQMQAGFITMLTHELKTPITVIKEGVELVLDEVDGPLNPEQAKTLDLVAKNISRLKCLVTNVLDFQKLDAGYDGLEIRHHALDKIIGETADLVRPEIAKSGLDFVVELPPDPVTVPCDAERVKQVIFNLLENAVKFTPPPGKITLRAFRGGKTVNIEVEDSGVGIRAEDQAEIFEMFRQSLDETRWNKGGFGVGLAICRKIVTLHHGTIRVESAPGRGSRFVVELPAE